MTDHITLDIADACYLAYPETSEAPGLDIRLACAGGTDEHWQIRLDPHSEMPDLIWTEARGVEPHPDGRWGAR